MKLSDWAKKNGLTYQTAYKLFKDGNLPVPALQLNTGTILVTETPVPNLLKTYIYCRVSSNNKKEDLNRQAERCEKFCLSNGWEVEKTVKEIASGMNDNRKKLSLLLSGEPKRIVVEHKDRLTRFGFNYLDTLLKQLNYELVVINREKEEEADLMKDLVSVVTSFCCRLYGMKKGLNKSKQIKTVLNA